ncbi:S-layer homology domain-containing protein [Gracilibacillus thailandensis]|uniref:S-layer homology domain-containing protein n=1 Tax=Gracilibacillus thailandensis TaxID=563735 RepID=A0A6N7QTJ9_9BACI|nr:S-layer homology domain-containing protein [Gracilibacillus thailandensis]MRI64864.1 S-layer homology domain-containing protein [Gracilibacillus thailandensis]
MIGTWNFVMDFIFLSVILAIATVLKTRIPYLSKVIIPTSMIAGFLGLLLGTEFLGIIPFNQDMLGNLVYHFMAIGFIAISLKERNIANSPAIMNAGILIVSGYVIQGIVGFGIFLFLVHLFFPDFFPGIGLLLPLGFGQGPGQAYSIGTQWEALGVTGGGNLGLTIAGIGFIWATVIGIIMMNLLAKRFSFQSKDMPVKENTKLIEKIEPDEIPLGDASDKLTFQIALIGTIYFITYLTIYGLNDLLQPIGTFGETLGQLLIGFHFIIGSLYAVLFRMILNKLKGKGIKLEHTPNNYLLQRIAGFSFDYMIAAAITAISIYTLQDYFVPVLLITTAGGLVTILFFVWIIPKVFPADALPNILGFYGMQTGTISTGMALVKAVDPKFQSNTTDNLVMGSGTALLFGFPLLLILNIPIVGYVQDRPIMYLYTMIALVFYFAVLLAGLLWRVRKSN